MGTASSLQIDGQDFAPAALGPLKWSWTWTPRPGQVVRFERSVGVARAKPEMWTPPTWRGKPGRCATARLARRRRGSPAWARRWQCSAVEVDGDAAAQQAFRFAIYDLNSAANPTDDRVSIGARALTSDDYRGHVFLDAEIYLLPFYILTWPDAARALLMYRFRTLEGARAKAAG